VVQSTSELATIYEGFCHGRMSRRDFVIRAAALGVSASLALALVNWGRNQGAAAQDAPAERPDFGTQAQRRGEGGELKVRQWIPPSTAVALLTDFPPSSAQLSALILEPLLSYGFDGALLPTLATEVPTKANGGLSDDLTRVTLNLRDDVLWSDGEPFTADDVVWTWQWVTDESNQAVTRPQWSEIRTIEALSPTQVQLTFTKSTLVWFAPIAGSYMGSILPRHLWSSGEKDAVNAAFATKPIGTGPYKIETFVPGEPVVCTMNERYREPNKPYFDTVRFKAGGDGASDAQAVLVTGDWDVAALLTVNPSVLQDMVEEGGKGQLAGALPINVERIELNFTDPNQEIDGERSSLRAPHPFLTDRTVRQAMTMAIDRETITRDVFAGSPFVRAVPNILTGIPLLESPNTSLEFDVEGANRLLDEAGWDRADGTRNRDGIALAVSYYTLVIDDNAHLMQFRPAIQAAVTSAWEAIGIEVQPGQVAGDEFFDISPDNPLSYKHFYRDVQMYATGPVFPVPDMYFADWYAGPDNSNVAQMANDWQGNNLQRYVNPAFDALYEESTTTTDLQRAAELFIQMNDLLVGDFVVIPLHARPEALYALSNRIAAENVAPSSWEPVFWNIANWRTVEV
jgi:peptide/nickel transport system substrate-binding protein